MISMTPQRTLELMISEAERLKTFEDWPNETTGPCTPEKLAQVGFYFSPCADCPDNVCCIFCSKELDGWERDDDPFEEHKKHSVKCPILKMPQPFSMMDLTIEESFRFMKKVTAYKFESQMEKKQQEFEDHAEVVLDAVMKKVLS